MPSLSSAALVFLASSVSCLAVGRVAIRWLAGARWLAAARYEDCPPLLARQQSQQPTPTMGGLFVLGVGVAIAAAAGGLASREGQLVCGAIAALGAVGLCDDYWKFYKPNAGGLRPLPKLLAALAVGGGIGALEPATSKSLIIPWTAASWELGWWRVPFAMLVMGGCAHAVNLTDGMDGLAAGCVAIALSALGCWALAGDGSSRALVPWCASLAGACVGFLWFNSFPASVFMGDVGALGLGAAVGAIALLSRTALWLAVIGGIFVLEAVSVMLQVASYKWRNKRRIFRIAPIHHHFHLGGVSEPKLIVRFWIAGLLLALLSVVGLGWR